MGHIETAVFLAVFAVTVIVTAGAGVDGGGALTAAVQNGVEADDELLNGTQIHPSQLSRAPFDLPTIPHNTAKINFFLYYSKSNPKLKDKIVLNEVRSLYPNFQIGRPVIFLTHGYVTSFDDESEAFVKTVKKAYLDAGYVNIIEVDWKELEAGAASAPAPLAVLNYINIEQGTATDVGIRICKMIMFLTREGFIRGPEDVHILGYSLGAHVSGVAGRCVNQKTRGRLVRRITGLDPAIFFGLKLYPEGGLDRTDATFVDMVHTDLPLLGTYFIPGHVDFFANGGWVWNQHGCLSQSQNPIQFLSNFFIGFCAHARAYRYFAKSILDSELVGCRCLGDKDFYLPLICLSPRNKCRNPILFGQYVPTNVRGRYYLPVDRNVQGVHDNDGHPRRIFID